MGLLKSKLRSVVARLVGPQVAYLERRIDDVEDALHRATTGLGDQIDERSYSMAQLAAREVNDSLTGRLALAEDAAMRHTDAVGSTIDARIASLVTDVSRLRRRIELMDRPDQTAVAGSSPSGPVSAGHVDELLYLAIEDRFRGDPGLVRQRQERYVPHLAAVADAEHPVLDLGCGRGELLAVLTESGIPARGVDANPVVAQEGREAGLDVVEGELVDTLASTPDGSLGGVTLMHVVEHLPFGALADVFAECARVLRPGGILIAETPNALNLRVAATNFWLDPTHVRPLHPGLLRLLAERAGFERIDDLFLHDIGTPLELPDGDDALSRWAMDLSRSLDGPGDYAIIARTPGSPPDVPAPPA